jgi:uncharacterized protein DUF5990
VERELTLRIVLEKPPGGIDFGVQKGKGSIYEIVQKQRSRTEGDLTFEFGVRVVESERKEPHFLGPFVQGPPAGRFVYINIGASAGQINTPWNRRLKVPLLGITWKMVDAEFWRRTFPEPEETVARHARQSSLSTDGDRVEYLNA